MLNRKEAVQMAVFTLKVGINSQIRVLEGRQTFIRNFPTEPWLHSWLHHPNEASYGGSIYFHSTHTHHPTWMINLGLLSCLGKE